MALGTCLPLPGQLGFNCTSMQQVINLCLNYNDSNQAYLYYEVQFPEEILSCLQLKCLVSSRSAAGNLCLRPVSEKKVENESSPGVLSEGITPKRRILVVMLLIKRRIPTAHYLSIEATEKKH